MSPVKEETAVEAPAQVQKKEMNQPMEVDDAQTEYLTEDQGVAKTIIHEGTGEKPENGDEVKVNYIGRLYENKELFDSNESKEDPFVFTLGQGMVIKGWDIGVASMKKGEKSRFVLKPDYAYGSSGSGAKIPPNSTLEFDVELLDFKSSRNLTEDGKVQFKVVEAVSGEWKKPESGHVAIVSYQGMLADGSVFCNREEVSFTVDDKTQEVVPRFFSEAVKKMHKGEVGLLTVGSEYAYGTAGNQSLGVPPSTDISYKLKLIKWNQVDKYEDGAIVRILLEEGEGWERPKDTSQVKMNVSAVLLPSKRPFFSVSADNESLVLGSGDIPEALETCLLEMKKGSKAEITAPIDFSFGPSKRKELNISDTDKEVQFTVELVDFTKVKENYELSQEEKLQVSEESRLAGNKFFKEAQYRMAIRKYDRVIKMFQYESKLEGENKKKVDAIVLPCRLNLAASCMKLNRFSQVKEHCAKALELSSSNVKALYRRAQAHYYTQEYDLALKDLTKAMELDPQEASLKVLLKQVKDQMKIQDEKDKKVYAQMFKGL